TAPAPPPPPPAVAAPTTPPAAGAETSPVPVEPTAVRIPSIGVTSPLVDLGLTADGALDVPEDFDLAGWFELGTVPGDPGPAVVAGHVDSRSGPAVFYRLRELSPGDLVEVDRSDGAVARFRVDRVEQYPKARFPTAAVYGPAPGAQLRLITCGGVFDRSVAHYRDNVVVYATAA
ncbi:MAG: class F sortase, partial [Actinomycetota bacterium]|nr:class F sortase [Actinomycetota bacterium]